MVSAQDSRDRLLEKAPVLAARLNDHNVSLLKDPDEYTLAHEMLIQYSNGTTTFTQSELQHCVDWSVTPETLQERLETLETVGFIIISRDGREHTYTIKEPLELWLDDSPITDLPVVASSEVVTPVRSTAENSHSNPGVSVGPFRLPEPTPERLTAYQKKWATRSVLSMIGGLLLLNFDSTPWLWLAVILFVIGLVYGSMTAATFTARQLQDLRSRHSMSKL